MNNLALERKRDEITRNDLIMAKRLARKVIDKPEIPVWMILIPIFFIFQAFKIKQYSKGLERFADHYLVSRKRALAIAYESAQEKGSNYSDSLDELIVNIPEKARSVYREWMSLLISHYLNLLNASGESYSELILSHYQDKSSFLQSCYRVIDAEHAYNQALMPVIEGEREELRSVLSRMRDGLREHYEMERDMLFGC